MNISGRPVGLESVATSLLITRFWRDPSPLTIVVTPMIQEINIVMT